MCSLKECLGREVPSPTDHSSTDISWTCLPNPAVYHKPHLPVHVDSSPPLCSVYIINWTSFSASFGGLCLPCPDFLPMCLSVCLLCLPALRSVPRGCGRTTIKQWSLCGFFPLSIKWRTGLSMEEHPSVLDWEEQRQGAFNEVRPH